MSPTARCALKFVGEWLWKEHWRDLDGFRSFPLRIGVGQYKSGSLPAGSSSVLPLSPASFPGQRLCARQVWLHAASPRCLFYFDLYVLGICVVL